MLKGKLINLKVKGILINNYQLQCNSYRYLQLFIAFTSNIRTEDRCELTIENTAEFLYCLI